LPDEKPKIGIVPDAPRRKVAIEEKKQVFGFVADIVVSRQVFPSASMIGYI